ncbi:MAG: GNAT family N-acetyltransferase [Oscillospiraceae bacterium]|nr:GNAT family N-acetyltransferase [Oscillospiraceae bacterium]
MFTIKKAVKEDAGEIAALADIIWHEYFTPIIGAAQVDYMLAKFQSEEAIADGIGSGKYEYYRAFADDEFTGYMGVHEDKEFKSVLLSKIYVKKEYRGRGIAKMLLKHVMDIYSGAEMFWLTVNRHNDNAIAAYDRLGFKTERESVTDIGGGFVMDDYVMTLRR